MNLVHQTVFCVRIRAGYETTPSHDISVPFQHGWTSLMKASFQGHNEVIELLLAAGANTDLKNQVRLYYVECKFYIIELYFSNFEA